MDSLQQLNEMDFPRLRREIVGADATFKTPFGNRMMVYCDYTASGRCLAFVERYLMQLQRIYANTHTEDDITGRSMTQLLHQAEARIKKSVNAGPDGTIIACGAGSTAAIDKLQQILGIALCPATRKRMENALKSCAQQEWLEQLNNSRPVIFIGPYEHHSNEITWRQNLAEVVTIPMDHEGDIDLGKLEAALKDPRWKGRQKIGSFSAGSNVTGILSPVHKIAALLHAHAAIACFDYAACAPYVPIDMCPKGRPEEYLDAVFISPHKFLGGPGSSGVLVFNSALYDTEVGPTVAGGGTVDYVGPLDHDFTCNIEEREKAGTPGVLQTLKAALAFMVKDQLGCAAIEKREQELLRQAFDQWLDNDRVEVLGNPDPARRVAIISFNLRDPWGGYLHPKLVTVLLNDLFGIQSRAGCSCAGPYGHYLLGIDNDKSEAYRRWVKAGYAGIKPGWCRIGFHFVMDDEEAEYIIEAVQFLAKEGWRFLHLYQFDLRAACWNHREPMDAAEDFSLAAALTSAGASCRALDGHLRKALYDSYLREAREIASELEALGEPPCHTAEDGLEELKFFRM